MENNRLYNHSSSCEPDEDTADSVSVAEVSKAESVSSSDESSTKGVDCIEAVTISITLLDGSA